MKVLVISLFSYKYLELMEYILRKLIFSKPKYQRETFEPTSDELLEGTSNTIKSDPR